MDDYYYNYYKRSGEIQIPAFGDWENANEVPITQYFQCARQAGLVRYCSSSSESLPYHDLYCTHHDHQHHDLSIKPTPPRKTRVREKRCKQAKHQGKKQQKLQGKVCDVSEQPRNLKSDDIPENMPPRPSPGKNMRRPPIPKPVDEDLYKIPPELLYSSKRNKMLGLFSSCLVPCCNS